MCAVVNVLKELPELAYPSVADEHVQTSPFLYYSCDKLLSGLWIAHIARDFYQPLLGCFFAAQAL
jgi:hypothetical protein